MIIWRGWGVVVVAIAFIAAVVGVMVADALSLNADHQTVAMGVALLPAAVVLWFLGKRMNANARKILIDPETGAEVRVDRRHDLFFIPVQWWGPIGAVLGVLLIIVGLSGSSSTPG